MRTNAILKQHSLYRDRLLQRLSLWPSPPLCAIVKILLWPYAEWREHRHHSRPVTLATSSHDHEKFHYNRQTVIRTALLSHSGRSRSDTELRTANGGENLGSSAFLRGSVRGDVAPSRHFSRNAFPLRVTANFGKVLLRKVPKDEAEVGRQTAKCSSSCSRRSR